MTQEEMEQLEREIRARFPELHLNARMDVSADYSSKTFTEKGTIAIWSMDHVHCLSVVHNREQFDALVEVARYISRSEVE